MPTEWIAALIADASLAPSVHNVQPARWRVLSDDTLLLVEDQSRRLRVGDPTGNDAGISLGAAVEGMRLAASQRGLTLTVDDAAPLPTLTPPFHAIARYRLASDGIDDPLAQWVPHRRSWRGAFVAPTDQDRYDAQALVGADRTLVIDTAELKFLAPVFDRASYRFTREDAFRAELRSWMRLKRTDPNWARDGLNADAMALSRIEAMGAGLVLGPLFSPLATVGLASSLLAEGGKVASAAAVVLYHRPIGEPPMQSGAAFYRLWLEITAAGFSAAVLAALADDTATAATLQARYRLPETHRIVSAFRIGRAAGEQAEPRARLPLAELLV